MSEYNKYSKGSEWRRWDLHIHTKGTKKNDNFTSVDFDDFCKQLFQKALEKEIAVIGITDYFTIENYLKVLQYQQQTIDSVTEYTPEEKDKIKAILLLPNIELRMLPVTNADKLINIHCIINPDYVENLDHDFFSQILHTGASNNYAMNRAGFIQLGKELKPKFK